MRRVRRRTVRKRKNNCRAAKHTYDSTMMHSSPFHPAIKPCPGRHKPEPEFLITEANKLAGMGYFTLAAVYLYRSIELHISEIFRYLDLTEVIASCSVEPSIYEQWQRLRDSADLPVPAVIRPSFLGLTDKTILLYLLFEVPDSSEGWLAIQAALHVRNTSWLAHGDKCIDKYEWEQMSGILLNYHERLKIIGKHIPAPHISAKLFNQIQDKALTLKLKQQKSGGQS